MRVLQSTSRYLVGSNRKIWCKLSYLLLHKLASQAGLAPWQVLARLWLRDEETLQCRVHTCKHDMWAVSWISLCWHSLPLLASPHCRPTVQPASLRGHELSQWLCHLQCPSSPSLLVILMTQTPRTFQLSPASSGRTNFFLLLPSSGSHCTLSSFRLQYHTQHAALMICLQILLLSSLGNFGEPGNVSSCLQFPASAREHRSNDSSNDSGIYWYLSFQTLFYVSF